MLVKYAKIFFYNYNFKKRKPICLKNKFLTNQIRAVKIVTNIGF